MKIFAAVGLNHNSPEKVRKIILAGADAIRYSFVCGDINENIKNIENGIDTISDLNSSTKVIVNLPTNKLRIGGNNISIAVLEGEHIIIRSNNSVVIQDENKTKNNIVVETNNLGDKVYINQIITIDHGKIAIEVVAIIDSTTIEAKILNSGHIQSAHTFNITSDTEKEQYFQSLEKIIQALQNMDLDFISIPFIDTETNSKIIKKLINSGCTAKYIIRIENENAINNIEKILEEKLYSYISINRGELGDNLPYAKLGIIQKNITSLAKKYHKKIIVSSQILEGAIDNFVPLRSDILDLTNMIIDGIDGILLTNETALSTRPAYTISIAKKIILETNKFLNSTQ